MTPTHLQGHGTYDYACRLPNCWHCAFYGLKPLPEITEQTQIERVAIRTAHKKKYRESLKIRHWTKEEDQLIVTNIWMNTRELTALVKRSKSAIACRIWKLRTTGKLYY